MPSAVLVQVAEAVAAELREHDFGVTFDAIERNWADFEVELEELNTLRCDVVGVLPEVDFDTRESLNYVCPVDIVIRKRFGQADQTDCGRIEIAEIDRLVLLVEQINELFCDPDGKRLATFDSATWKATDIRACASRDHLKKRMFLGVIRVTYDTHKAL